MSDYSLDIMVYAAGIPFTGAQYHARPLGGSESSAILMSEELVKLGNNVTVFSEGDEESYGKEYIIEHNSVRYFRLPEMWQACLTLDWDVVLIERDYGKLTDKLIRTRQLGLLNHDILTDPQAFMEHAYPLDFMYCLTEWHKYQYENMCPDINGKISVLGNPIDVEMLVKVREHYNGKKSKTPLFVYNSRPERGLLLLLKFIWPEILKLYPDAELHVAYYLTDKEKLPPQIQAIHQTCEVMMSQMPGVTYRGGLNKETLYRLTALSHAILYPGIFPESFNISAVESQILGTPYLCTDMFAMQETVINPQHRIFDYEVLNKLYYDNSINAPINYKFLTDKVKKILVNCVEYYKDHPLTYQQKTLTYRYDKKEIARRFEFECRERFQDRLRNKSKRIVQNLIYHSDYVAARYMLHQLETDRNLYPEDDTYEDLSTMLSHVETLLDKHHDNPEDYHEHAIQDPEKNKGCPPRMARAIEYIKQFVGDKEFTLTDLGVGEGRGLYNILSYFKDQVSVQGVDFSAGLLQMTADLIQPFFEKKWESENGDKATDYFLHLGDPFNGMEVTEQSDVVWAGEILEHQQDVVHALNVIDSWTKPGGLIVLTMPYGPWEVISNDMQERIYHVQHFERRDLEEILVDYEGRYTLELIQPQHSPKDHSMCANWVVTIKKPDIDASYNYNDDVHEFHYPNYQRKFETTRPYVKLGLTCITKNEEENIAGFLKPFIGKIDHICLYDTGSGDQTIGIADKLLKCDLILLDSIRPSYSKEVIEKYNNLVISGYWDDDFAAARNRGLEYLLAKDVDWVLWGDCDERITNPHLLKKYLTGDLEVMNGFILFQVQLMKDEENTRDIPVRLFRANKGYKFSGVVHEQVYGWGRNEYVDPKISVPDIEFIHYGYVTPEMRWNKVRYRNLALMEKEHQINPNRDIGIILYTRDLLHVVTWEIDKNKPLDNKLIGHVNQVIQMLQKYIDEQKHICHPLAMIFYQQALQILGESGVASYVGQVPIQAQVGLVGQRGPLQHEYRMQTRWFLNTTYLASHLGSMGERIIKQLGSVPRLFDWQLEK